MRGERRVELLMSEKRYNQEDVESRGAHQQQRRAARGNIMRRHYICVGATARASRCAQRAEHTFYSPQLSTQLTVTTRQYTKLYTVGSNHPSTVQQRGIGNYGQDGMDRRRAGPK